MITTIQDLYAQFIKLPSFMRAPCVNFLQIFLFTTHITCRSIAVSLLSFPTLPASLLLILLQTIFWRLFFAILLT